MSLKRMSGTYLLLNLQPLDSRVQLGPVGGVEVRLDDGSGLAAELGVTHAPDAHHGDVRDHDLAPVGVAASACARVDCLEQTLDFSWAHPVEGPEISMATGQG